MNYNNLFKTFILLLCLSGPLLGQLKEMSVGYTRWKIDESLDEGEYSLGYNVAPVSYWDGYISSKWSSKAFLMVSEEWTDANGNIHPVKATTHGQWDSDRVNIIMPVPDEQDITIRRIYRYDVPGITVNGVPIEDFFPINEMDEVAPSKLPGTVDGMITSYVNTDMGVSVRQKVYGFSQKKHDNYIIREYTFINTGNIDIDDEIELEGQTIKNFYFGKQLRPTDWWTQAPWLSYEGYQPGSDLRIMYYYGSRHIDATYDNLGNPASHGMYNIQNPWAVGEAIIFASKSPQEFNVDDINQPRVTTYVDADFPAVTRPSNRLGDGDVLLLHTIMTEGASGIDGINYPDLESTKPGSHGIPTDQMGVRSVTEIPALVGYIPTMVYSCGPYNLEFGDSIKIVVAEVIGAISPEKAWEVSQAWLDGSISWGDNVRGGATDILPPQYQEFPDLYRADNIASEHANWAKDNWVLSGIDSLLNNARAAKWAYENNFNVPQAPPAPSVTVTSQADGVMVEWGTDYAVPADLAGFRVYRMLGNWYPAVPQTQFLGGQELVYTAGPEERSWFDSSVQRGVAYFYAVTAFDDGTSNGNDYNGPAGSLESNFVRNVTTKSATKLKPGVSDLDSIRVVPNPYNLSAVEQQFPGEPNKIIFVNIPAVCTIRIFTESGDLIKTIEHNGSGDATWGDLPIEHMVTSSKQIVVSGVYIAHFETPDGRSAIRKFVIVR
jgi:hypothetical protein